MNQNFKQALHANQVAMETIHQLQLHPEFIRKLDGAQMKLSIPPMEWEILKLKYPVLVDGATYEKKLFMEAFINSSESKPFRVISK